jgi:hypothetical protein
VEEGIRSFYKANLSSTAQQVRHVFEETMGQSVNPKWFLARKNRITASIAHKVCSSNMCQGCLVAPKLTLSIYCAKLSFYCASGFSASLPFLK